MLSPLKKQIQAYETNFQLHRALVRTHVEHAITSGKNLLTSPTILVVAMVVGFNFTYSRLHCSANKAIQRGTHKGSWLRRLSALITLNKLLERFKLSPFERHSKVN